MKPGISPVSAVTGLALLMALLGAGSADPPPDPASSPDIDGEVLIADHACFACHAASDAVRTRLAPIPAPDLTRVGARLTPDFLRRYLAAPSAVKPETTMPDLLHGMNGSAKRDTIEDLVHYLQSRGGPFEPTTTGVLRGDIATGGSLFDTIGCRACHESDPSVHLAEATDVTALEAFLRDPLSCRPSGRMPSFNLTETEAELIAVWLLRDQVTEDRKHRRSGLIRDYLEGDVGDQDSRLTAAVVKRTDYSSDFAIQPRDRNDLFAFRFRGSVDIPRDGEYTFYTTSDDGSWLWIDGRLVVDNGGVHGNQERSGRVVLTKGLHGIVVTMFERRGGESLAVRWEGPDIPKGPIPAERLSHETISMGLDIEPLAIDPGRAERGKMHFARLGCASCHEPAASTAPEAKSLTRYSRLGGCLSSRPRSPAPRLNITAAERQSVRKVLDDLGDLGPTRTAADELTFTLDRLGCRNCHPRDGSGGLTNAASRHFVGLADLGEEGRVPPDLTGVGRKLRPEALTRVLREGHKVRPPMVARMPVFGDVHTARLPALFAHVDAKGHVDREVPNDSTALHDAGRRLVGNRGFNCVECHSWAGQGGPAEGSIDLADAYARLRPDWVRDWFTNPAKITPGTRMPQFWDEQNAGFPKILGGDPARQMDAILAFMRLGRKARIPKGVLADQRDYDLIPREHPIVFASFMSGVSARTVAVGLPEGIHYAFDRQTARLAKAWRGDFINAAGMWHNRGTKLQEPDSVDLVDLPAGDLLAVLPDAGSAWPTSDSRIRRWRMLGMKRDAARRPIFLYRQGEIVVEETLTPISSPPANGEAPMSLRRTLRVESPMARDDLYIRLRTRTDEKARLELTGNHTPITRDGGEVIVPVRFTGDAPARATLEVTVSW